MGSKNSGKIGLVDKILKAVSMDYNVPLESVLTDEELLIFERWEFIHGLMLSRNPIKKTKKILNLTRRKYNISPQQFYLDRKNAQRVFGQLLRSDREYKRNLYAEWMEQVASLAFNTGDLKVIPAAVRELRALLKLDEDEELDAIDDTPRNFALVLKLKLNEEIVKKSFDLMEIDKLGMKDLRGLVDTSTAPVVDVERMTKMIESSEAVVINEDEE